MGARETALNALIACRKGEAWSSGILKEYMERDRLDRREAALAARLCYGVLQNRERLDFYLKQLLTGKLRDLHPAVRDVLHLGLYQLYFMDKIPQSAAVNESVSLARKYCPKQRFAPGLCNGVLRNAVRTLGQLKEPVKLSDRFSHPQKLIDALGDYVGKERLEAMLEANNQAPDTVVQVNTLRTSKEALAEMLEAEGVHVKSHSWMPDCLVLSGTGDLEKLPSFQKGLFYVQDCAAKLAVLCAGIAPGMKVLDCCAAPGGKSFAAAMALRGEGSIHSCDVHGHKTHLIENGAKRLGLDNVSVYLQDATQAHPGWEGAMDVVICDVPCSGYGIIRKKPDIRFKDPDAMKELPGLQLEILRRQADYVRPGGVLLYATCTLLYRENEGVVKAFLKSRPDYTLEKLALPEPFPENESGMLALVPGEYDTDGFFFARLRRTV